MIKLKYHSLKEISLMGIGKFIISTTDESFFFNILFYTFYFVDIIYHYIMLTYKEL
jgi:hypothetical protein